MASMSANLHGDGSYSVKAHQGKTSVWLNIDAGLNGVTLFFANVKELEKFNQVVDKAVWDLLKEDEDA
jgi:hypothetical protein